MRYRPLLHALLITTMLAGCRQPVKPKPTASAAKQPVAAPASAPAKPAATTTKGATAPRYVDLDQLEGHTVVLVTHPRPHILGSLREVVREKLLAKVPKLKVVGVFHGDEQRAYDKTFAYLKDNDLPWLGLLRIGCPLEPKTLFKKNACSETFAKLIARSRGIIFTGGADIPPALYGEETSLLTVIRTPQRQYWELSLLFHLLGGSQNPGFSPLLAKRPDFAVLGICMGMQAMNVASGGTLHQDILSEIYGVRTFEQAAKLRADLHHRNVEHYLDPKPGVGPGVYHPIKFVGPKQGLWKQLALEGKPVKVMSIHHQSLKNLGRDLEVTATSVDGKVIEAVRHKRFERVLGVQFHPEYHFLASSADAATGKVPRYARPPTSDEPSQAFHRRIWERFFAGALALAPQ